MQDQILEISNVTFKYGKTTIINNLNLNLTSNKIVGLCGPNGAGKTTLIKMIVGLLRDFSGEILIDKSEIGTYSKSIISYQPDVITLDDNLTVQKANKYYSELYPNFNNQTFIKLVEDLKIPTEQKKSKMSKGMVEKFQLALTLAREAKIYIFDEPIAGVDPASRDSILRTIINNYTDDALLIISTHLIQDIESILDEIIFINEGQVTLHENCEVLREQSDMSIDEIFREEFKW